MANSVKAAAVVVILLGVAGCKTPARNTSVKDTAAFGMGDFDRLAKTKLPVVCGLLMSAEDASCHSEVIEAVCKQGKLSLDDAIVGLISDPKLEEAARDPDKSSVLLESLRKDFFAAVNGGSSEEASKVFTKSADRCLNHQKYKEAEEFERLSQTEEFKRQGEEARRKLWVSLAGGAVSEVVKQAVTLGVGYLSGKVAAPNTVLSMHKIFWSSVCSGGFRMAAGFAKAVHADYSNDACKELKSFSISRLWSKECLNVYGASCAAYMGSVDLRNLGLKTDNEIANFVLDTTNFGLWGLCNAGGPGIRVSCGTINYAANQIGEAIRNGDNDLARCTGTSQLGACIGQMWGQGRWTNQNGVETPRRVQDRSGQSWQVTGCCLCEKQFYLNKSLQFDPKDKLEYDMRVIQAGDFSSGNCAQQEGKKHWFDIEKTKYYIYRQCKRVDVVGGGCGLQEADENAKLQDVERILWDNATKLPARIVTRTGYR